MAESPKTVRVIAYNPLYTAFFKTVGIFNAAKGVAGLGSLLQAPNPAPKNEYPTVMAAGAANHFVKDLPSICIPGYSAPS